MIQQHVVLRECILGVQALPILSHQSKYNPLLFRIDADNVRCARLPVTKASIGNGRWTLIPIQHLSAVDHVSFVEEYAD